MNRTIDEYTKKQAEAVMLTLEGLTQKEIGFDHAFLVGVLFIIGMIALTMRIREGGAVGEAED